MLGYQREGKGQPVVLLHAFPLSSRMWKKEIKTFSASAQIIALDLPGFGGSKSEKVSSVAEMAAKVAELLDHLKIQEPVALAGLSMGGYVSFEFLRQFPKRIKSLGLFSTRALPDSAETREKRFKGVEAIQTHGVEPYGRKMIENLLGVTTRSEKPDVVREVMEMILENKPEGPIQALRAMAGRRDSSDLLSSIQFPVSIIAGEEDAVVKPDDARALHSQIPGSKLHLVPKCGHLINLEQPAVFEKLFQEFLLSKA